MKTIFLTIVAIFLIGAGDVSAEGDPCDQSPCGSAAPGNATCPDCFVPMVPVDMPKSDSGNLPTILDHDDDFRGEGDSNGFWTVEWSPWWMESLRQFIIWNSPPFYVNTQGLDGYGNPVVIID